MLGGQDVPRKRDEAQCAFVESSGLHGTIKFALCATYLITLMTTLEHIEYGNLFYIVTWNVKIL
jgi:hypothetical protein